MSHCLFGVGERNANSLDNSKAAIINEHIAQCTLWYFGSNTVSIGLLKRGERVNQASMSLGIATERL